MDAIGPDEDVDLSARSPLELDLHPVPAVDEPDEPVAEVQALGRELPPQRGQQVGAVHLVLREAERLDHRVAERRVQERPAVVPAALMPGEWAHAHRSQVGRQAEAIEEARGVRADLDAGADLAQRSRPLVHVHVEPCAMERQR